MTKTQQRINHGASFPFDCWDGAGNCTPTPATNWAHAAARGIFADLTDRRDIKTVLYDIDQDVQAEMVQSITEIILTAERTMRAPATEGLEVVEGSDIIKGNENIACERGDAKPDLKTDTSAVYPKPSDLRGEYP
jgi:hypothetical protein